MTKSPKLYYKIGEVAKELGVSISQIRKWENEFKLVKPQRTPGGTRQYSDRQLVELREIKKIIDEKSIRGDVARNYLKSQLKEQQKREQITEKLVSLKEELSFWLSKIRDHDNQ